MTVEAVYRDTRRDTNDLEARVLVVEDDSKVGAAVVAGFRKEGYDVELITRVELARDVDPARYAAIVLDLHLPDGDGIELLLQYRSRTSSPIIVLSAKSELRDRLHAFSCGAADFVPKPFFIEELLARVETRTARSSSPRQRIPLTDDGLVELDRGERALYIDGKLVPATAVEINTLVYLVDRRGRAVSRVDLAEAALSTSNRDTRTVDSHVARLRKKLGPAGARVNTVWGIGYRFD